MYELNGRAVLVTGAAKRIGRALALALARAGADVAITYLSSETLARQTLAELGAHGGRSLAVKCDVREEKSVKAALDRVHHEFGGLDVLVNNAGFYETVNFEELSVAQWDAMFAANVRGPFLLSRLAAPLLRARKGRIINIGSLGGSKPWATHAHYCASKAALEMLTKAMAKALAPEVAVNCVAPGMIWSSGASPDEFLRKVAAKTPMKRAGTPDDVAEAVLFFATATTFITGQTLLVDGGLGLE
jgi:NAD(P)-dependent dehydrogenase (short-subunit alcohol dehydrogenase family)